ncbi:MAG: RDD family protein, partial [Chloroflexi bacterium]|nr:RDD family protein [Chloroflexota bacterium]
GVRPGGFWYRVLASFIDDILTSGAVLFLISVIGYFSVPLVTSFAAGLIYWASLLYAPVLLGIWSTTVGKRALNMYVLKLDGSPVGFWRALGREVAKGLMAIPFGLTFWFVAFREDKRGLHDLIAGTVVVQR